MSAVIKCGRCRRRMRRLDGWNVELRGGVVVAHLCPDCQTPEENAEAEIHEATLDYGRDDLGRVIGSPKAASA
ncbi:hypothetical protein GII35_14040 [Gordonia amarae]|nr:hypothetical protein GII35_14040 [Gordonia amarae]